MTAEQTSAPIILQLPTVPGIKPLTHGQAYYQKHAEQVKADVKAWQADDPTGEKKWRSLLSARKMHYKKKPTLLLAMSWYALFHQMPLDAIPVTLAEVREWARVQSNGVEIPLRK